MSETPQRTTVELLAYTLKYEDVRHVALVKELGRDLLLMAADESRLADELTEDLSKKEMVSYYQMDSPADEETPAEKVVSANERFDAIAFNKAKKADKGNALRDYRIAAVWPGRIVLTDSGRNAFGPMRGDHFTISATVNPKDMTLAIEKSFIHGNTVDEVTYTDEDKKMIFDAAELLVSTSGADTSARSDES